MRRIGSLSILSLALVLVGTAAVPAGAGGPGSGPGRGGDRDRRIAVGDVVVAAGETVDGPVIAIDGRARVEGAVDGTAVAIRGDLVVAEGATVDGDVVVVRGDARIAGTIDGDVVVLGGRASVQGSAVVRGDVRSTDAPVVARGARVTGDVDDIDIVGMLTALGAGLLLLWWFAVTLSTALLGVLLLALVPRALESAAAIGRDGRRWWYALVTGVALVLGLPVLALVLVTTVVGLPFGLGLLGALGFVHALGYVAGAFFVGRLVLRAPSNRFGAFFVGWGILRLVALVPGLGVLAWIAASGYGVGMLAVAAFRAGQAGPGRDPTDDEGTTTPATTGAAPA